MYTKVLVLIPILAIVVGIIPVYSQSATYGLASTYDVPQDEQTYIYLALNWIKNAAQYGYHRVDNVIINSGATDTTIYSVASTSYSPAHVFFVGHGGYDYDGTHITLYIVDQNGRGVYDVDIYQFSSNRNVHLAFLYSCYQGKIIGATYTECTCSPSPESKNEQALYTTYFTDSNCICYEVHTGMAQAWLHTNDLSPDGYRSPDGKNYVFIGWKGPAPFLSSIIYGDRDVGYRFVGHFFSKLYGYYTSQAENVIEALNHASYSATGKPFYLSYLYTGFTLNSEETKIVVYGDGRYGSW